MRTKDSAVTGTTVRTRTKARPTPPAPAPRRLSREQVENAVFGVLRWVVVAFLALITAFPLIYLLSLSVRPLQSLIAHPTRVLPDPSEITLDTYRRAFGAQEDEGFEIGNFMLNSLLVGLGTVVLAVGVSVLGAYAVSRLGFFGKRTISVVFLSIYLFPAVVLAIPLFALFTRMGLRGSLSALVVIYLAQTVPVCLFMLRNFFSALPEGLEDAAAVDGAGRFRTIWSIVLPLSVPSVAAAGLYVFIVAWNEFLFALLFLLESRDKWTVSLGIALLDTQDVSRTVLLAASVAITLPIVIVFLFAQRVFVEGLASGAAKE